MQHVLNGIFEYEPFYKLMTLVIKIPSFVLFSSKYDEIHLEPQNAKSLSYKIDIFTHLKLCLAAATHNTEWVRNIYKSAL